MNAKKRKKKFVIVLNNLLMVSSIVIVVYLLILMIQGWTLKQGVATQTGLVQFASSPQVATVEVDQNTLYSRTNTTANVVPGEHEIKIWREGYETWYRKTDVQAGQILWLNYARLVPKQKTTHKTAAFSNLKQIVKFPNGQKLLSLSKTIEGSAEFKITDIRSDSPKTETLKLPEVLITREASAQAEQTPEVQLAPYEFTISRVSADGSRAIVQRQAEDGFDWLLLDLNSPNNSQNLTEKFNLKFDEIAPLNDSSTQIIVRTDETVRLLSPYDNTLSASILNKIVDFEIYSSDIIGFVQKNDDKFDVGVLKIGDKPVVVARGYETVPKITISRYYNENYINVLVDNKIQIYKSSSWPAAENNFKLARTLEPSIEAKSFKLNNEGRFVLVQNSDNIWVYDFELDRPYAYSLDDKVNSARWLDDFILYDFTGSDEGGAMLTIRDFDGANKHPLVEANPNFPAFLSSDGKYIYVIQSGEDGVSQLIQLRMILC